MKNVHTVNSGPAVQAEADRLADFVLFTQRSCILNLSGELSKGNVSFPQFFLLAYLSSEEYLTMSDIAKKMGHSTAAALAADHCGTNDGDRKKDHRPDSQCRG